MPRHPRSLIEEKARHTAMTGQNLQKAGMRLLIDAQKQIDHAGRMLESLSFRKVLDRGYAVVWGSDGTVVSSLEAAQKQDLMEIEFRNQGRIPVRKA